MVTLSVNGERICDINASPSTRLIEFLRSATRFRGPKLACGEGGCGACAVLCERYNPVTGVVSRCSINSCLATVGALDGCAITTSEGLGNSKKGFHPIQDALAKNFASQCGFCTPGITVALAAAAAAAGDSGASAELDSGHTAADGGMNDHPAAVAMARGLDGNLCRCTGWRPIIDACRDLADLEDLGNSSCTSSVCDSRMDDSSSSSTGKSAVHGCSKGGKGRCSNRCNSSSSSNTRTCFQLPPFPDWLKQYVTAKHHNQQQQQPAPLAAADAATGAWSHNSAANPRPAGGQVWLSPSSLQQLSAMLRQHAGEAQLVSGNTGSGVYKELWPHGAPVVITTHSVAEMTHISHQAHGVILGGAVTMQQLVTVLRTPAAAAAAAGGAGGPVGGGGASGSGPASTAKAWGSMADHLERIAGVLVRSAATLGGHFGLCDRRPLPSDLALVLAAAGAKLQVMTVHTSHSAVHQQQQQQYGQQWRQWGGDVAIQQQQQQFDALDLKWMSVEAFLANSAVGKQRQQQQQVAAVAEGETGADLLAGGVLLGPDCIAGAQLVQTQTPTAPPAYQQQQAMQAPPGSGSSGSSSDSGSSMRVVTAVWLPYADDSSERFWSYKLSWRHVNSHAFVNMALWMKFDSSSSTPCSSNSSSGECGGGDAAGSALTKQAEPEFAGCSVSAIRLFVGCPVVKDCQTAAADDESWLVLRSGGVEEALTGGSVTVQSLISALRGLERELQQTAALSATSFHSQALQGMLFKALVPIMDTHSLAQSLSHSLPTAAPAAAGFGNGLQCGSANKVWVNGSSSSSSRLLRLLQLPCEYDPRVLPQGRQVLPPPAGCTQQQQQQAGRLRSLSCAEVVQRQPRQQQQQQQQKQHAEVLEADTADGSSHKASPTPAALIRCHPNLTAGTAGAATDTTPTAAAAAAEAAPGGGGVQSFAAAGAAPLHQSVEKEGVRLQASGEAEYTADVAAQMGGRVLYLAGVRSTRALAALACVDASAALPLPGVVACFTAADIPGDNEVFGAPLLADGKVEYVGQLVALVAAHSQTAADRAAKAVCVTYTDIPGQSPIITLEQAIAAGSFYDDPAAALRVESVRGKQQQQQQHVANPPAANQSGSHAGSADLKSAGAQTLLSQTAPQTPTVSDLIASAPLRLQGCYSLPAQQHMYMETQTAVAEPGEDGCVKVWSATQSLDAVQQAVAAVLGVRFHQVVVMTKRLGGGFGGKASRSMPVAAAAALAASLLQRPVYYSLNRHEDFAANGGRCAGQVEYEAGYRPDGKLVAIQAKVIFRAGAHIDLAMNDGATLLAASDSAYDLSGLSIEVKMAKCNLPPHTIMRGPGFLQGCMFMEQILEHVAAALGKDSAEVKAANFLPETHRPKTPTSSCSGNSSSSSTSSSSSDWLALDLPSDSSSDSLVLNSLDSLTMLQSASGTAATAAAAAAHGHGGETSPGVVTALGRVLAPECHTLRRLWRELLASSSYQQRVAAVREHNEQHAWSKRGIVVTPVRFDCAPAAVSASLSVYADGSVLVNHGGIEMGQGLSTKVKQAAVAALSQLLPESQRPLPLDLVRLSPSSSCINPNGGPTWSSTGSEGNCQAVMNAAAQVVDRLRPSLKVGKDALSTWQATIAAQFSDVGFAPSAVMLSAYGYFDGTIPVADRSAVPAAAGDGAGKCLLNGSNSSNIRSSSSSSSASQAVQYSAFGAAVTEVELDLLTGERRVLATDIAYDCGYALNPRIDLGQVEGAFVMGLGVMLSEEVVVDPSTGGLKSDSTWTYKIPTPDLIPQKFTVSFLSEAPNPVGIAGSKASGEPALMTSTSALLALQQAAAAAAVEVEGLKTPGRKVSTAAAAVAGAPAAGAVLVTGGVGEGASEVGQWRVLAAPATPQRLKDVIGPVSIADALERALAAAER